MGLGRRNPIHTIEFLPTDRKIHSGDLNTMRDLCAEVANVTTNNGHYPYPEEWLGIVDATGQVPYGDERYWVKRAYGSNSSGTVTAALTLAAYPTGIQAVQATATNLGEALDHTHNVKEGTYVWVKAAYDAQKPAVKHYYFCAASGSVALGSVSVVDTLLEALVVYACDSYGVTSGGTITVYCPGLGDLPDGTTIDVGTIVPFQKAGNGNNYVLGAAHIIVSNVRWNAAAGKLEMKQKLSYGWFTSTESDWLLIDQAEVCEDPVVDQGAW